MNDPQKRNELMHLLSHQIPEFSQVLLAGETISNNNLDYFYKRVSRKRQTLPMQVDSLWSGLSCSTEALMRYDRFLRCNPDFPELFKTPQFEDMFVNTLGQGNGTAILGHQVRPTQFFITQRDIFSQKPQPYEYRRMDPAARAAKEKEVGRLESSFSTQYELKYFNALLNALTNPLPPIYVNALKKIVTDRYSQSSRNRTGSTRGSRTRRSRRSRRA